MKKEFFIIMLNFAVPVIVFGDNNNLPNEQTITPLNEVTEGADTERGIMIEENNYQDQILSNPETNAGARVGIKQGGGNTAVIRQNGHRNSSSITQSGDSNMAIQSQVGTDNQILLNQSGRNNLNFEEQTGSHNRKVIIQNDTETILEQVTP
jgi:hypothetical protein